MKKKVVFILIISFMWIQSVFAGEIVKPQSIYQSQNFSKTVNETMAALEQRYPDLINIFEIGQSVQGESILAVEVGSGPKQILINAAHHARESLTTVLVLDQIDYIAKLEEENKVAHGSNIRGLLDKVTFVFVPLLNPDGANLVLNGKASVDAEFLAKGYMKPSLFKSWKANINGVDLNQNYPTQYPGAQGRKWPSSEAYKAGALITEPETKALVKLCEERLFDGTISYHSSGEIIFWHFNQKEVSRDYQIAKAVSKATGYSLVGKGKPSKGNGFKDWFVEKYQKPGLTIEISPYVGPQAVPFHRYQSIWEKNKNVPTIFASQVNAAVSREIPYIPKPKQAEIPEVPETPEVPQLPEEVDEAKESKEQNPETEDTPQQNTDPVDTPEEETDSQITQDPELDTTN